MNPEPIRQAQAAMLPVTHTVIMQQMSLMIVLKKRLKLAGMHVFVRGSTWFFLKTNTGLRCLQIWKGKPVKMILRNHSMLGVYNL